MVPIDSRDKDVCKEWQKSSKMGRDDWMGVSWNRMMDGVGDSFHFRSLSTWEIWEETVDGVVERDDSGLGGIFGIRL